MLDILSYLPAKRKSSPSGWISFNAVCCSHNGNSPDRRQRGGLKVQDSSWSYHCFNCGYTASFALGRAVSFKARRLLSWLGVPDIQIEALNLESMRHRSIHGLIDDRRRVMSSLQGFEFNEVELPAGAELITADHTPQLWQYVRDRHVPDTFPIMTRLDTVPPHGPGPVKIRRPHVIVPFTYDDRIVGYTMRFLDDRKPKYLSDSQPGYVFGVDQQPDDWQHVLVMEGIFDALCIGGVAVMHNDINDEQARLIRSLGREVTVIPDQDASGLALIDRALELGWAVSIPNWENCKDVNDAVKKYGRLGTLLTIMQSRETSRIKIELARRRLVKQLSTQHDA